MKQVLIVLAIIWGIQLQAAINPLYQECMQRGYTVDGDSCVMPDGSKCFLEDFNTGACGSEFFEKEYCVPEGEYVWDGPCCEGLVPYLPDDVAGQATCQPRSSKVLSQVKGTWMLWLLLGLVLIIIVVARRRRKKEE